MMQRAIKRGDVRTFDESYNKGYKNIWASEVDADFDQLYAAVNSNQVSVIYVDSVPPFRPSPGQMWFRNDPDANLYIWYDDGSSAQWVPAISSVPNAGVDSWIVNLPATITPIDTSVTTLAIDGWTLSPNGLTTPSGPNITGPVSLTAAELTLGTGTEKSRFKWNVGDVTGGTEVSYNRKDNDTADDPAQPMWFYALTADHFQINRRASQAASWETFFNLDHTGLLVLTGDPTPTWNGIVQGQPGTGKGRWSTSTVAGSAEVSLSCNRNPLNNTKDNAAAVSWQLLMSNQTNTFQINHAPVSSTTLSTWLSLYAGGLSTLTDTGQTWGEHLLDTGLSRARVYANQTRQQAGLSCNWDPRTATQDVTTKSSWALDLNPESGVVFLQYVLAGGSSPFNLYTFGSNSNLHLFGDATTSSPMVSMSVTGLTASGRFCYGPQALASMSTNIYTGTGGPTQDDITKPSWYVAVTSDGDGFVVQRSAAGSAFLQTLMSIDANGNLITPPSIQANASSTDPIITLSRSGTVAKGRMSLSTGGITVGDTLVTCNVGPGGIRDDISLNGWAMILGSSSDACSFSHVTAAGTTGMLVINPSNATFAVPAISPGVFVSGNNTGVYYQNFPGLGSGAYTNAIAFGWNGSLLFRVDGAYQGPVTATPSDRRFKLDISEDVPGLEAVMRLRPVSFIYDQSARPLGFPAGRQVGLIAQDAVEIVPTAVYAEDMSIDYAKIVPVLIRAIQELANGRS